MKFAMFSLMQWPEDRTQNDVFRNEIAQAVEAEKQGYDAVWLGEHHFSRYGIGPSIHLTAAHIAALTNKLRIGTAVTILPFFHPVRVAEEIAMLDIFSNGRINWGTGRGYQRHEFDGFGVDINKSHLIFREQLEIIKGCWREGRFGYKGEFFSFPDTDCLPKPVQNPMPIWIAALSPSTNEWAAMAGYPTLTDQFAPTHKIAEARVFYHETAKKAGHKTSHYDLPALRHVYVGETFAKAREQARPALLWYYRSLANVGSPGGPSGKIPENYSFYRMFGEEGGFNPDADPDKFCNYLFDNCVVVGDAAFCRERIAEMKERFGLNYIITWQNFGNLPHAATMASQKRFIEEVAPAFA
ncbi:LLM class flavin-dependent oxidoreductase [Candidatus Sumerlaeota bacterium]|nr:LLM class flavin-dependent oxidoreductase [Candidatus Sumerlaeota bacterium]